MSPRVQILKTPTLMRSRKGRSLMDDKPEHSPSRKAKENTLNAINTSSTKKRSASPHGRADRPQKARRTTPTQYHTPPATRRRASHNNLIEPESIIYAVDMEKQIAAEARGVTRKNIPWDKFCSTYL